MAEKDDPFEAALASLDGDDKTEQGDASPADKDPFDLGEGGLDAADGGDLAGDAETSDSDPFEAAMQAMDAVSDDASPEAAGAGKPVDPFEAAMQEVEAKGGGAAAKTAVEQDKADDPFASALEVAKAEHKVAAAQKTGEDAGQKLDIDFLMEIKLNLTFEVGRTKMYISDLLSLGQGSVIELHRLVGEELELFVNGQLLATGEVVVVNEKFGARITKILSPEERINHLGPFAMGAI
ncbi:MAG: flagellar motor switch protein FliN [Proteobacteria bacterium]|nr:flagellar motor switch protein FliN [Pseudomonadota bacterium]